MCFQSCAFDHGGEEEGAAGQVGDEDVFVDGVGAGACAAEAVERGDAEGGGEVSVGASADGGFFEFPVDLFGDCLRFFVERGDARGALHGHAVDAACDGEFAMFVDGAQGAEFAVERGGLLWLSLMRTSISTVASAAMTLVRVPPRITPGLTDRPCGRLFSLETAMIWRASSRMALCPLPGSSPACEATPFTVSVYSPTPLRAVLTAPRGAAGSSTSTAADSLASASVILREELAADFFVGNEEDGDGARHRSECQACSAAMA
jgi:hypothetical protein